LLSLAKYTINAFIIAYIIIKILTFPLVVTLAMGLLTFSHIFVNKEYLKKISIVGGVSVLKGKDDKQNPNAGINHTKGPI
jgi:hypothetical protein